MRRRIALATLILAIIPAAAHAQTNLARWRIIRPGNTVNPGAANDPTILLDTKTIVSESSSRVTVWLNFVYGAPQRDSSGAYTSAMFHQTVDCKTRQVRYLGLTEYGADGAVVHDETTPYAGYEYIVPGSLGESVSDAVCK